MAYNTEVLADSPGFYHRLNEASGTTATDASPNTRNSTYAGTIASYAATGLVAGDTAITLAGAGAVEQAYGSWMDGNFTCEGWYKLSSLPSIQTLFGRSDSVTGSRWVLVTESTTLRLYVWTSAVSAPTLTASGTYATNTTYHIALTRSGDTWTIYVNGSSVGSSTIVTAHAPSNSLTFGADKQSGFHRFISGTMDEIAYYPTALSSGRISAHYAAASSTNGTVSAVTATASAAAAVPTVSGVRQAAVAAVAAVATAACLVPAVTGSANVAPPTATAAAAAPVPSVSTAAGVTVAAVTATAAGVMLPAAATGTAAVAAAVSTASAAALVPTLAGTRSATVTAVTATATGVARVPVVHVIAPQVAVDTPPARTLAVLPDTRTIAIPADNRALTVTTETRNLGVTQ